MGYDPFPDKTDLESTPDNEEGRRAYITETIKVAADDARNLVVMATVAVGIVVFLLKDSIVSVETSAHRFPC